MFSFFLLHKNDLKTPLTAVQCNVRASIVGCSGQGRATLQFDVTDQLKDALVFVPALLCHSSGSRTNLRVTNCDVQQKGEDVDSYQTLKLVKNSWGKTTPQSPYSYYQLKSSLEKVVYDYGVAGSRDDVLLNIGNVSGTTTLVINIDFVLTMEPAAGSPTTELIMATLLPSRKVSINLDILPVGHIEAVALLGNTPASITHSPLDQSNLSVDFVSDLIPSLSTLPVGFSISLTSGSSDGALLSRSHSVLFTEPIEMHVQHRSDTLIVDGIQILSNILPPIDSSVSPSEFIFLVDCSCSMCGHKIQSAAEALLLAIKSLPIGCYFNVVAFGSKYRALFQTSVEVSDKSIDKAAQFVTNLKACLGGTELLSPLRWLLRKPVNAEVFMRQILLITDGSVPDIRPVLDTVARHKQSTRVHSFALGPDICSELMAGVSSITKGHYVVVGEEDRLQTKVMEVMRKCLYAPLTTPLVRWSPPSGYSISSIIPSKLYSPIYGGSSQSMFALLKKTGNQDGEDLTSPSASISGTLEGVATEVITTSHILQTTPYDSITGVVLRAAAWCKLASLHNQLLHPPKTHPLPPSASDESYPPTKKLRLNGHCTNAGYDMTLDDLISISLSSRIPCFPHTIFISSGEGLPIIPVLPWNGPPTTNNTSAATDNEVLSVKVPLRKRPRHQNHSTSAKFSSISFSSIAKTTAEKFSEAVKSVVNIATLGMMDMESDPMLNGEGLEDQEYYNTEKNRIHWNYNKEIVVPDCYYTTAPNSQDRPESRRESDDDSMCEEIYMDCNDLALSNRLYSQSNPLLSRKSTGTDDTGALPLKPNYTSIVELQLPNGAWSLIPSIALATGVPMAQIMELPLQNGTSKNHLMSDSSKGHFWATVLALACLEFHFAHFKAEWLLLAHKAENWLQTRQTAVPMSLSDAQETAKRLVSSSQRHH